MRRSAVVIAGGVCLFAAVAALAWGADTIDLGSPTVPYKLTANGNTETGVVKYHVYLTRNIHEGGEASKWDHPVDDRQCDWSIQGHMDRVVCFTSIMGGTSCNNDLAKNLPISVEGRSGSPSNFLDHRPCSDFIGQIDQQTNNLKSSIDVNSEIQRDLNGDLKQQMQGSGVTVNYGHINPA